MLSEYPIPGTTADRALDFIQANPGCSQQALTRHLNVGAAGVQRVLRSLVKHQQIQIEVDELGHKQLSA